MEGKWRLFYRGKETPISLYERPTLDIQETLYERPTLDIQETEINFLNGKMLVPGKIKWLDISFSVDSKMKEDILPLLEENLPNNTPSPTVLEFRLYDGSQILEAWQISDIVVKHSDISEEGCNFTIGYSNVKYKVN
jgi:hypothetical protein